jgi:hypothetical protein
MAHTVMTSPITVTVATVNVEDNLPMVYIADPSASVFTIYVRIRCTCPCAGQCGVAGDDRGEQDKIGQGLGLGQCGWCGG